jgi:hypothetical protein
MDIYRRKKNEGIALLTATILLAVAILVLGALAMRVVSQNKQVAQFATYRECFQGLEAAYALSRADLERGGDGMIGVGSWTPPATLLSPPSFEDSGVEPIDLPGMPGVQYVAVAVNWASDGVDNEGDALIDGPNEAGMFTIHGFAHNCGVTRHVEAILESEDINVWNNAIFAGAGHVSGAIQGNCSIHGSVHILGEEVPEGGEAVMVLDMMGASLIHNNYGIGPNPGPDLPDYLSDRVPLLPQTIYNGEIVDTLLRVKNGLVSLNSAAEIGSPDIFGNRQKESMDGTFNSDGWTGTRVTDDGDRGDPGVVYSDNGWDHEYDLGDKVSLPILSDDWRWPANLLEHELGYSYDPPPGSTEISPDGDNYLHEEFFAEVLSDGAPYSGDVLIENDKDFYLNLTRPGDPDPANRVKGDAATITSGDDYLYYDSSTHVLEINGQIEIDGNLEIAVGKKGASNPIIYYTGRAVILAHGDVRLNADLLTCNDGNPADYLNSFPARNCLGIMAENDMFMGDSAQLDLMGAFYAQGCVTSAKQTVVMGTFVATYFDMGSQVPDIFQVPELANNLPLGMIGNWPIWVMSPVSWREIGV